MTASASFDWSLSAPARLSELSASCESRLVREHNLFWVGQFEIDINDAEPPFLAGQTAAAEGGDASPVKIVKNPDGSMSRAAMTQARERPARQRISACAPL